MRKGTVPGEQGMKIATIDTNIEDPRGPIVLKISQGEPEVSAIWGKTYFAGVTG
jgi:hypothetical protein